MMGGGRRGYKNFKNDGSSITWTNPQSHLYETGNGAGSALPDRVL